MLRLVCAGAVAMCMIVPRVGVLIACAVALTYLLVRNWTDLTSDRRFLSKLAQPTPVLISIGAFLAWVFIACIWASDPIEALEKAAILAIVMLASVVIIQQLEGLSEEASTQLTQGVLIGFLIGGLYTAFETISQEGLTRFTLTYLPFIDHSGGKHVIVENGTAIRMSGAHMTRVSFEFALFLCPAILATLATTRGALKLVCLAAIAAFSVVVILWSRSQTAQLVVILTFITLAFTLFFRNFARIAIAAGFALLVLFIVPIALGLFAAEVHKDPDLFRSARARVVIWDYTAKRVLEHPILGVGTYSTRFIHQARIAKEPTWEGDLIVRPETRDHPHNVYLQVWYELGVIGALLFGWMGLMILRATKDADISVQPFLLTQFAMTGALIGPTYGMWQSWFQFSIAAATVALAICAACKARNALPAEQSVIAQA